MTVITPRYVRKPPFFDGLPAEPGPLADIEDARVLALLGDSVTTDHISPAGVIRPGSPAGRYLTGHGIQPRDFNSYGSRRLSGGLPELAAPLRRTATSAAQAGPAPQSGKAPMRASAISGPVAFGSVLVSSIRSTSLTLRKQSHSDGPTSLGPASGSPSSSSARSTR